MKFNIGDKVKYISKNDYLYIILKSKLSIPSSYEINLIKIKSNILDIEETIEKCELKNFDYAIVRAFPSPNPQSGINPEVELVYENNLILQL